MPCYYQWQRRTGLSLSVISSVAIVVWKKILVNTLGISCVVLLFWWRCVDAGYEISVFIDRRFSIIGLGNEVQNGYEDLLDGIALFCNGVKSIMVFLLNILKSLRIKRNGGGILGVWRTARVKEERVAARCV